MSSCSPKYSTSRPIYQHPGRFYRTTARLPATLFRKFAILDFSVAVTAIAHLTCSSTGTIFPELSLKTTVLRLLYPGCGSSRTYFVNVGEYRAPIKHLNCLQEERCLQLFVIQPLLPCRCLKLLSLGLASPAL